MTFTNLPSLASHIRNHHISFGGDGGFGFVSDCLSHLGEMNAQMTAFPAMVGATFLAWQDAVGYGFLRTEITITKLPEGGWLYEERVA